MCKNSLQEAFPNEFPCKYCSTHTHCTYVNLAITYNNVFRIMGAVIEWVGEWISEWLRLSAWLCAWVSLCTRESINKRVNDRVGEGMGHWMKISQRLCFLGIGLFLSVSLLDHPAYSAALKWFWRWGGTIEDWGGEEWKYFRIF